MNEQEPQPPVLDQLDVYLIGGKSLREWQTWLCTDEDGQYDGDLQVQCSQWGLTGMDCTWAALAIECARLEARGEPDDAAASMQEAMEFCVNNNDSIPRLLRKYKSSIPEVVLEHLDLEEEQDESWPDLEYDSPRDELLHAVWHAGWANSSSGDDESPTGRFARVTNRQINLAELSQVLDERLEALDARPTDLLGHFLLAQRTTENRGVVLEFPDEDSLIEAFEELKGVYEQWKAGNS